MKKGKGFLDSFQTEAQVQKNAEEASSFDPAALLAENPELAENFDATYYLESNPDVKESGMDPLYHYITYGKAEGRKPMREPAEEASSFDLAALLEENPELSANFDATYYLEKNPDVKESGMDPLYHYITFGKSEGRKPMREPAIKRSLSISTPCDQAVLIFDHRSGGGTLKYLFSNLINPAHPLPKSLLAHYNRKSKSFIVQIRKNTEVVEEAAYKDWSAFIKDIGRFKYSAIIVDSLVYWPSVQKSLEWIAGYKRKNPETKVEYKGHNYYCICPSYTLQDHEQKYCGIRWDEVECGLCIKNQGNYHVFLDADNSEDYSVSHWRQMWNTFFRDTADVLEVFSPSSKDIFLQAYPEASSKLKLNPHKIRSFDRCNVAVLGYLSVQKGSEVIRTFCSYLDDNEVDDMHLFLFGENPTCIASPHLSEMGAYERNELPEKLKSAHIDVVFIPSVCPETFCYTAGESLALGYPTACFDLGGQADQVRASENGVILYEQSPEYLYTSFKPFQNSSDRTKDTAVSTEDAANIKTVVIQDKTSRDFLKWMYSLRDDKSHFVPEAEDSIVRTDAMPKIISFYLPQFHDFPENIRWFGRGFSEWSNTSLTVPQFIGHLQPQVPIDVGYYNLQTTDVMHRQAELAKKYGIAGFCIYYYWFSGKKLMEKPLEGLLEDKDLDFPFFFFWANEHWTRLWGDGNDRETLYKSEILPGDAEKFMADILPYMRDSRYICVHDKPMLIIYKLHNHPKDSLVKFIRSIRAIAKENGLNGIYISGTIEEWMDRNKLYEYQTEYELDAITEFSATFGRDIHLIRQAYVDPNCHSYCFDMPEYVASKRYLYETKANVFKGLFPSWDNTPRRYSRGASILQNTPEDYKLWLSELIADTEKNHSKEEQIIFVNAWNEWAEGAHLEPDTYYGYAYLQKTREALEESDGN